MSDEADDGIEDWEMVRMSRYGKFVTDTGAWWRREDDNGVEQTYLVIKMLPGADLSSRGSRQCALDRLMEAKKAERQPLPRSKYEWDERLWDGWGI